MTKDVFCHDKHMFVATKLVTTKMILVSASTNDITGDLMCNVNKYTYNCMTMKEDEESNSPSGEACVVRVTVM